MLPRRIFPRPPREFSRRALADARSSLMFLLRTWHRHCRRTGVTMKHAAAFVILLTIAGTPVTALACVSSCLPDAVPADAACHHQMQTSAAVGVKDAEDACAQLFGVSPFVKEELRLTARAAVTACAPPAPFTVAPEEARLASARDGVSPVPPRSTSSLVLRL